MVYKTKQLMFKTGNRFPGLVGTVGALHYSLANGFRALASFAYFILSFFVFVFFSSTLVISRAHTILFTILLFHNFFYAYPIKLVD